MLTHTMHPRSWKAGMACLLTLFALFMSAYVVPAQAQEYEERSGGGGAVFEGGGLQEGVDAAGGITGITNDDPRQVIIRVIEAVLEFAALLATAMIIIAGFYLVLSNGNEDNKDKAKKIIYYTLAGLVVILFSRILVELVTEWLAEEVA
jgi:hypothetical protein